MDMNDYQAQARTTAIYPEDLGLIYTALGLTGESGEVAEKVKKMVRDGTELNIVKKGEIALELGDVLWYIANLAHEIGVSLETIAKTNIKKINNRAKNDTIKGSGDQR
jgi:NTP pyrophosphatase (non-canonical NTP hydrolase)